MTHPAFRRSLHAALTTATLLVALALAPPAAAIEVGILHGSFWTSGLETTLDADPGINVTQFNSCDAATLSAFDVIWLYGNGSCYDEAAFDAFAQAGGGVIGTPWVMGNEGHDQAMLPYSEAGDNDVYHGTLDSVVVDPADPILDGVTFNDGDAVGYEDCTSPSVRVGATVPAEWVDGDPLVAYWEYGAGRVAYLNLHYITSDCDLAIDHGWGQQLAINAVYWAADELCVDGDGDGYDDADCGGDDCDDADGNVNPGASETYNGVDDDCDGHVDEYLVPAGAVLITEIMKDPAAVDDADGEWFEVYNASAYDVNLNGWEVYDLGTNTFTVGMDLWLAPGEYGVAVRNDDEAANGGIADGYEWSNFSLANSTDDEVILDFLGDEIDRVEYSDTDWPDTTGASLSLSIDAYDVTANDDPFNWCDGEDAYGLGDLGTPGAANPICCPDDDGDGYEDLACGGDDCDDADAAINPAADEYCDGVDNDCDGTIDEDDALDAQTWYQDLDGDAFGNDAVTMDACSAPSGYEADGGDCDDTDATTYPGADEYCDGVDNDCDGTADEDDAVDAPTWYLDDDGDAFGDPAEPAVACGAPPSYVADGSDCDDGDAAVYPGADEYCNGHDDDCDGTVDEDDAVDATTWYLDDDGDGWGDGAVFADACDAPADHVADAGDCDDTDPAVNPGMPEYCNGVDDDCDGDTDEPDAVDALTWYQDFDGDGFGTPLQDTVACDQPQDYVLQSGDCDDDDAAVYPGADEYCNGYDDDCDQVVDESEAVDADTWYRDADGDSFGDANNAQNACDPLPGFVGNELDCDDNDAAVNPGATEYCDGVDNDCDGDIDEDDADDATTWYEDVDGDGYGNPAVSDVDCDAIPGYVPIAADCDDADASINPGAEEVCDGVDNDCDADTDEAFDSDGDGFTICDGDCDDAAAEVNPDAAEICDFLDNDCDPSTDENVDGDGDFFSVCAGDCDDGESTVYPSASELCDGLDNDCDGTVPGDEVDFDGDAFMLCDNDCDDDDALTYPGAPEQCDQIDNDCDGDVDEDVDQDLDGDGVNACQGDCDNNNPDTYPGALEICDGEDNDCDGDLPEDEVDADGDGWMPCNDDCDDDDPDLNLDDADEDGFTTCDEPPDCDDEDDALNPEDFDHDGFSTCDDDCDDEDETLTPEDMDEDGYSSCDGDCDDDDDSVFPDALESCDGLDNDCDGVVDNLDADGDGHAPEACGGDDCDDIDPDSYPGAAEVCDDGADNDCDGLVDDEDTDDCDEGDDDDTADDDDDDDTGSDDDDTYLGENDDCSCRNDIAAGTPASPLALLAGVALLALRRRRA